MPTAGLDILYEDNHLLVINKPAGLATMGVAAGHPSAVTFAKEYLKHKYHKPGNVFLGVVSRLDEPVSGVLVLARTSKAAGRLSEQFRAGTVQKTYWALTIPPPQPADGSCTDWLAKDDLQQRVVVVEHDHPAAKEARLTYATRSVAGELAWVEVTPTTGRKHQIRVQLAQRQAPIFGDRKYGGRPEYAPGIALHAYALEFQHPTRGERLRITAPMPRRWRKWGFSED